MKPLDYSLYNKVKEKFPPLPMTVIFISLAPDNLEKLEGTAFRREEAHELMKLVDTYAKDAISYAAIGGYSEDDIGYTFCTREFEQEEDLLTGQITESSIGTYHNNPVDIEALKREMKNFNNGTLLTGNA